MKRLVKLATEESPEAASSPRDMEPAETIAIPESDAQREAAKAARAQGEALIRDGRVGVVLVAGGQGTRLGFDGPKGAFPIGPVTGKSLFEMHAEKIRAASAKYGVRFPWYIMTSETNDAATKAFFDEHDCFGLPREDVFFFQQRMIPAVDIEGRIILDEPGHIFMSPNGHGGCLLALHESGALDHMRERGVEELSYFQVDNVLIRVLDPVFLGYHAARSAAMSLKVLRKRDAEEKLGVVGLLDGRLTVIEYSDLTPEEMYATTPDGRLKYWAGNIAIHALNVDFVASEVQDGFRLPYHLARKTIPYVDAQGRQHSPLEPNGIKFETFVFDALPHATRAIVMEGRREDEFSGVKSPTGEDSVESARRDLSDMFGRWIEAAGGRIARTEEGHSEFPIEISPLCASEPDDLVGRLPEGFEVSGPTDIDHAAFT